MAPLIAYQQLNVVAGDRVVEDTQTVALHAANSPTPGDRVRNLSKNCLRWQRCVRSQIYPGRWYRRVRGVGDFLKRAFSGPQTNRLRLIKAPLLQDCQILMQACDGPTSLKGTRPFLFAAHPYVPLRPRPRRQIVTSTNGVRVLEEVEVPDLAARPPGIVPEMLVSLAEVP